MEVGQIVICTDARYSEGRLKEGWRYVVERVWNKGDVLPIGIICTNTSLSLIGVENTISIPGKYAYKSSRFRPLTRKEVEYRVDEVIASAFIKQITGAKP